MKPFSLLIKPAGADCNLRCAYCFYLCKGKLYPDTHLHRMSAKTLETLIRGYMATPQPVYTFGWQGGEPTLMGVKFFKQATALQKKHGRPGSRVANGLQTNATLMTDSFAEHCAEYNFLLGISLDGPEEIHDRYRINTAGNGSHADVMKGIGRLIKANVAFNILTLVSQANVNQAAVVYRYLTDNGFLYHQYVPCVEFEGNGAIMPFAINGEQWGRFLCNIFNNWIKADKHRVSVRLFDSILSYLVTGQKIACHMDTDCRKYFVIEHNGDIYPCDFFVADRLKIGNLADTSWSAALTSEIYRQFGLWKSILNKRCGDCEFQGLCAGDCQKHRPFIDRHPGNISVLCAGWKMFYRNTLAEFKKIAGEIIAAGEQGALAQGGDRREVSVRSPGC